jgi:hypothetical protein
MLEMNLIINTFFEIYDDAKNAMFRRKLMNISENTKSGYISLNSETMFKLLDKKRYFNKRTRGIA